MDIEAADWWATIRCTIIHRRPLTGPLNENVNVLRLLGPFHKGKQAPCANLSQSNQVAAKSWLALPSFVLGGIPGEPNQVTLACPLCLIGHGHQAFELWRDTNVILLTPLKNRFMG